MDTKIGLKRGTVVLAKAHDDWQRAFALEKRSLEQRLGHTLLSIEHVGSTAIRHLAAKPIIDMLAAVSSLSNVDFLHASLEMAGYQYRANGPVGPRLMFAKGPEERRTHYLHITEHDSIVWRGHLAFRDYLLAHEEEALRYESLKRDLAFRFPEDRASYTAGKSLYIEAILKKALAKTSRS